MLGVGAWCAWDGGVVCLGWGCGVLGVRKSIAYRYKVTIVWFKSQTLCSYLIQLTSCDWIMYVHVCVTFYFCILQVDREDQLLLTTSPTSTPALQPSSSSLRSGSFKGWEDSIYGSLGGSGLGSSFTMPAGNETNDGMDEV